MVRPIFDERIGFKDATYSEVTVDVYAEYGFRGRITLIGKLGARFAEASRTELGGAYFGQREVSQSTGGLSDLFIGLRYRVAQSPFVTSVEAGLKVPLGYDSAPSDGGPPLGNGEVDGEILLLIGSGVGATRAYLNGGVGYRARGGAFHDEFLYVAEVGYSVERWLVQVKFLGAVSTETPEDLVGTPIVTPLPGGGGDFVVLVGDQDALKWEPSASYRVRPGLWIRAGVSDVLSGKNTVNGLAGFASLVLR